jgi:hypothetical protein
MTMRQKLLMALIASIASISGCKARTKPEAALAGVERNDKTPPDRVYHFGSYDVLAANGRDLNSIQEAWRTIVGAHQPFRQGLYVAQHPAYAEQYGNVKLGQGYRVGPWLMEVILAPSCLDPQRIVSTAVEKLADDPAFVTWYGVAMQRPFPTLQKFREQCSTRKAFEPLFSKQGRETACAQTVQMFYERPGNGAKSLVIHDFLWPKLGFWYLRSPECVAAVRTSPEDIIRIVAEMPDVWMKAPFEDATRPLASAPERKAGESFYMALARALFESKTLNAESLDSIAAAAEKSDIRTWDVRGSVSALAQAGARCARLADGKRQLEHVLYSFLMVFSTAGAIDPRSGGLPAVIADFQRVITAVCQPGDPEGIAHALTQCVKPREEIYGMLCDQNRQVIEALNKHGHGINCTGLNTRYDKYGMCVPLTRCTSASDQLALTNCKSTLQGRVPAPRTAAEQNTTLGNLVRCMELVALNDRFGLCLN